MDRFDAPIFCGGYFKSGTSLLRAMISQHPKISGGLETHWFEVDPLLGRARNNEPLDIYIKRMSVFFGLPEKQLWSIMSSVTCGEEFLDCMMIAYARSQGKLRWVEKTPGNILYISRIRAYWPKSKFIHILRNPCDVYVSIEKTRENITPEKFVEDWARWISKVRNDVIRVEGSKDFYIEISYENLVLAPTETLKNVFRFLGEIWLPGLENFTGQPIDRDKVRSVTGKTSPTLERLAKPLSVAQVGVCKTLSHEIITELFIHAERFGVIDEFRKACGK